jgi:UDP-hydrolysing UDP-N-acetyl-D-glucosamine 2-epimerase
MPLMKAVQEEDNFQLQLLVTGMHLSPEFGLTYQQIERDGFTIDEKVEMLLSADSASSIAKSTGLGMIGYTDALMRLQPDWVIVLGDRYEVFAATTTAFLLRIPIAHVSGGEVTEGATDDAMRHAITKMSYLHFTSTDEYKRRVEQLGETPDRVFNVGAIGLDNILQMDLLSREALSESIQFDLSNPYLLVTFHPVTLESQSSKTQFQAFLDALDAFPDVKVVITLPNSDADGRVIINMIQQYVKENAHRVAAYTSLGQLRYLSAMKHAVAVVGNSSSGIIETPAFHIPTVNIGDRQRGRARVSSIIDCPTDTQSIIEAIEQAISPSFQEHCQHVENLYGDGHTTERIMTVLQKVSSEAIDLKKVFFDVR